MALGTHRNTFEKGMTRDYNIVFQPNGTYYYMLNCSLISQDSNNYVIKDILGNVNTFQLPIRYDVDEVTFDLPPTPIGFISFPDMLIVYFTNNDTESGGYGEIGMFEYLPYGEGIQPKIIIGNNPGYIPLYHHADLNFTILQQIEGFAFPENETIKRVYWTDNLNEPRVLDIGNPVYTTYIPDGSLVTGKQYMVLQGVVNHNGTFYGPTTGNAPFNAFPGNIFTAANANYTDITSPNPTALVIEYVPIELLSFTPSRSLGNISFTGYGTGSKYCGNKMYFYRLSSPSEGITTSWSYGSFPVQVRIGAAGAYFPNVGGGTPTTLVNSNQSVLIRIDNIDTNFERIQVAVAEFDQTLDVPRITAIIKDEVITGATMDFEDSNNTNLGLLTLSDLTLFPASILKCKTMTTNKNYNVIGNIQERGEFVFDTSAVTIEQINHPIIAHRDVSGSDALACANVMTYDPIDYNPFANPSGANAIQPYTTWLVTDDSGGAVTYNAVNYSQGEVITGVPGVFTITIPVGSTVGPCVSNNRYTTNGGDPRPNALLLSSAYWDYKDPTVEFMKKGLWDKEKYRYGIMFYDLKGNPWYVRHLGDLDTDRDFGSDPLTFVENDNDGGLLYINQTGAKISGITITPELAAQISGFSIVRAERDKRVITQGFLMQTTASNYTIGSYTVIQPACSYKLSLDNTPASSPGYYSLLSPDAMCGYPLPNFADGIGLNSTSIEEAYWLLPRDQKSGGTTRYIKSTTGAGDEFETKYFDSFGPDANSPRILPIQSQFHVSENGAVASFGNSTVYFQNKTQTVGLTVDTYCNTGVIGSTTAIGVNDIPAGGQRVVLEFANDTLLDYNNGAVLYSSAPNSGLYKMMVNITVPNTNQYGGNSPAALAATTYISTGHFQPINATVLSETLDGSGNYVFNDVEVWGGDCYAILADYGYSLFDDDSQIPGGGHVGSYSWSMKFPCLCNANYTLRTGTPRRSTAPDLMHSNPSPGNGVYYKIGATVQLEGFQYNQAYSSDGHFVSYPALPLDYSLSNRLPYTIRFAGEKIPGELINSFRTFLINDRKDVDGQGGEINNLRTKDGQTIVWQNAITSTVPILERQVVVSQTGDQTAIGTGGVIDRFDLVSSYFGNQHQKGLTATEYGFAWFDMRRKAVVILSMRGGIVEISKVDGLKSFFDEVFVEVKGNTAVINNNLLNDPTFSKYSDRPLTGVGICGVYDPKFKVTALTFKFINRGTNTFINKDFTILYSHPDNMFIGFSDCTPGISWNHNQIVLAANNPKSKTKYFGPGMPYTEFAIGDVVPYLNAEYIAIAPVSILSYPGAGNTVPDYPSSVYWSKINQTNEIWVHNQPKQLGQATAPDYLYSSFFGQVVNNEHWFVINPTSQNPFSVTNIEQEGNDVNFTDITITAGNQSASDLYPTTTFRGYRVMYDKICSNLPFSSTGRITNSYLLVKWVKKNWLSDPRVVSVGVKILRWVNSFFEVKR